MNAETPGGTVGRRRNDGMKPHITWEHGIPASMTVGAVEAVSFGMETADRHSFFTFERARFGCSVLDDTEVRDGHDGIGERRLDVAMAEGRWQACLKSRADGSRLDLAATLTTLSPSLFQDFVVRAVFSRGSFAEAAIGGERFRHEGRNRYHQHAVDEASLSGPGGRARLRLAGVETAGVFAPVLYVRDAPEGWVVHARLLPTPPYALLWVRWHNRLARLSLPASASAAVLALPWLRDKLWYAAERGGADALQLQASGLARLEAGQHIALSLEIDVDAG